MSDSELSKSKYKTSEDAVKAAGEFGRYQIFLCLVLQYSAIIGAGTFALGTLGRLFPTYKCDNLDRKDYLGISDEDFECMKIRTCQNRSVQNRYFKSMVDEWELVCDREKYQKIVFASLLVGRLLGNIIGGHIGDCFGRKRALYPSQFGHCIVGALSTACTQWYTLSICLFIIGICFGVGETTSFVLTAEETTAKYRWIQVSCFQWCLQYPLVGLIGYLSGGWRMYLIIINVIMAPVLVFYLMFLDSPRFLIYRGDYERAAKTLTDVSSPRWNKKNLEFTPSELNSIPGRAYPPIENWFPTPLELFRPLGRAKLTATLILAMLLRSLMVGLFLQDGSEAAGNPFVNITLYGIIRLWVPIFIVLMDRKFGKFGRRMVFMIFWASILLVNIIVAILVSVGKIEGAWGRAFGLLGASLAASGAWMSLVILSVEAYPTAIRGISFGWLECFNGVGNLIAPYFLQLSKYWINLPGILMIGLEIPILIAGYFVIPETKFNEMVDRNTKIDKIDTGTANSSEIYYFEKF